MRGLACNHGDAAAVGRKSNVRDSDGVCARSHFGCSELALSICRDGPDLGLHLDLGTLENSAGRVLDNAADNPLVGLAKRLRQCEEAEENEGDGEKSFLHGAPNSS